MSTRQANSIALLTSLPRSMQQRWIARTFADSHRRELAATAADIVAFPQPLDSPQLRDNVVRAAEAILAPHQNSLRRTVAHHRWRFVRYAVRGVVGAAIVVCAAFVVTTTKTSGVNNSASVNNATPTIAVASLQTESQTERPAEPLRATNRASLARLAAFTQGELLRSVGKTPSELTPNERDARDALAAALESLDWIEKHAAAEAVRRNQLGIALALQAESLREIGFDVATLEPEVFNNADGTLQATSAGDIHDVSLITSNDVNSNNRTRGGSDDSVFGAPSFERVESSAAWGELPPSPQSRSPRDEVMLLPPQYRRAGERFVEW